jgi:Leucine-rich repeat (LRR) protein
LLPFFPEVRELHFGHNEITTLLPLQASQLRYLNLQNNQISLESLYHLKALSNLNQINLQYNQIATIPTLIAENLPQISRLWISDNQITTWKDINGLCGFYQLEDLRINRNPVYESEKSRGRLHVVARFPSLLKLNGSSVWIRFLLVSQLHLYKHNHIPVLHHFNSFSLFSACN